MAKQKPRENELRNRLLIYIDEETRVRGKRVPYIGLIRAFRDTYPLKDINFAIDLLKEGGQVAYYPVIISDVMSEEYELPSRPSRKNGLF